MFPGGKRGDPSLRWRFRLDDTQIIAKKGASAVAFGPVGSGSYAAVEYVDIDSVVNTARVLERVVHRFCG